MSIEYLGGKKYRIDIPLPGKREPKKPGGKPRRNRFRIVIEADSELQARLQEQNYRCSLGHTNSDVCTIGYLAPMYLDYVKVNFSERTYGEKFRIINVELLPYFGNYMPDFITRIMIENFKAHRKKKHYKKIVIQAEKKNLPIPSEKEVKSINREINVEILCLYSLVRWAKEYNFCNHVLEKVRPLKYRRPVPDYYSREELMAIIDQMDLKHRVLFLALYQAGLRKAEACGLRKRDVHFDPDYIRVFGKGEKERIVPMPKLLAENMKLYFKELSENPKLEYEYQHPLCFVSRVKVNRHGKQLSGMITDIRAPLQLAVKKAGITKKIHPHSMRHSFATHMLESGADIREIQVAMGHMDIATTQIYTKVTFEHLESVINKAFPNEK